MYLLVNLFGIFWSIHPTTFSVDTNVPATLKYLYIIAYLQLFLLLNHPSLGALGAIYLLIFRMCLLLASLQFPTILSLKASKVLLAQIIDD